jgi:hypothetical protein
VWGTSYGPLVTGIRQDGSPTYVPDITEANAETIEYWNTRSTQAKHPILAARYSDLVWDFTKLANKSKPPIGGSETSDRFLRSCIKAGVQDFCAADTLFAASIGAIFEDQ